MTNALVNRFTKRACYPPFGSTGPIYQDCMGLRRFGEAPGFPSAPAQASHRQR
jgi:hypothetical protein